VARALELQLHRGAAHRRIRRRARRIVLHIGAIAKVVVKRSAAKARDESELYFLISDEIKGPSERKSFIRKEISISGKG